MPIKFIDDLHVIDSMASKGNDSYMYEKTSVIIAKLASSCFYGPLFSDLHGLQLKGISKNFLYCPIAQEKV